MYIQTTLGKHKIKQQKKKKTCCLIVSRTIWLLYIQGRGHPQCLLSNPAPLYTVRVISTESHTFRTTTKWDVYLHRFNSCPVSCAV